MKEYIRELKLNWPSVVFLLLAFTWCFIYWINCDYYHEIQEDNRRAAIRHLRTAYQYYIGGNPPGVIISPTWEHCGSLMKKYDITEEMIIPSAALQETNDALEKLASE